MRRLLIALLFVLAAETPALACSCSPLPLPANEARALADEIAAKAVALVEVDVLSAYDRKRMRGELMQVRRTLGGQAPRRFRIARHRAPMSASCDVAYGRGGRSLVLLYPATRPRKSREHSFQEGGYCTSLFLEDAGFRRLVIDAFRRRTQPQRTSPR